MSQEAFLREALHASTSVFILSAEAGWRAPSILAKWTEWKLFVSKMVNMEPPISAAGEGKPEGCFPRMIGPLLPLSLCLTPTAAPTGERHSPHSARLRATLHETI
ncbi:hypothetical protein AGDE_15561 [Angomonas deanei]|uniref:Uncharacterized protein n=1 Tax=Angomonas deanei TaxID=59799 RepID=A0A7G2C880_9TRYP|nr:hypothetical protein AGDE_15561 [Angomonas deanei]CAD2215956.1 hypothetical protein, conserved [Angomonas deanei]|eukprot:EPY18855.1 hypothetical protein AGDE_15561 [Angomonas deanei]